MALNGSYNIWSYKAVDLFNHSITAYTDILPEDLSLTFGDTTFKGQAVYTIQVCFATASKFAFIVKKDGVSHAMWVLNGGTANSGALQQYTFILTEGRTLNFQASVDTTIKDMSVLVHGGIY